MAPKGQVSESLRKHLTCNTLFQLLCASFTIVFIFEEMYTYYVIKPTVEHAEVQELTPETVPEILVCADPGFDEHNLVENGYDEIYNYALGILHDPEDHDDLLFKGWAGNSTDETANSLLEKLVKLKSVEEVAVYEVENVTTQTVAKKRLKHVNYPYGQCVQVSHISDFENYLQIRRPRGLNGTSDKIIVLLRDPANSADIRPISFEMSGDKIYSTRHDRQAERLKKYYKIKIKRHIHYQNDPHFPCKIYSIDDTFNDCRHHEIEDHLKKLLGCVPPLFSPDEETACNVRFSKSKEESHEILANIEKVFKSYESEKCKTPCTKTTYEAALLYQATLRNLLEVRETHAKS